MDLKVGKGEVVHESIFPRWRKKTASRRDRHFHGVSLPTSSSRSLLLLAFHLVLSLSLRQPREKKKKEKSYLAEVDCEELMKSWASGTSIFTQPEESMGIKKLVLFSISVSILLSLLLVIPTLTARSPSTVLRPAKERPYPVSFAYLISLSKGDVDRVKRMLGALYHPGNHYLLHLDSEASEDEHADLVGFVSHNPIFRELGNVWVVQKSNLVTYRGPTMLANTLHAMAMLLKACEWEWFVNLSAADYPLITQDGKAK